jgi:hypothetical protein
MLVYALRTNKEFFNLFLKEIGAARRSLAFASMPFPPVRDKLTINSGELWAPIAALARLGKRLAPATAHAACGGGPIGKQIGNSN